MSNETTTPIGEVASAVAQDNHAVVETKATRKNKKGKHHKNGGTVESGAVKTLEEMARNMRDKPQFHAVIMTIFKIVDCMLVAEKKGRGRKPAPTVRIERTVMHHLRDLLVQAEIDFSVVREQLALRTAV